MRINRRAFVSGTAATLCAWSIPGACADVPQVVQPEEFGAKGDGRTDDTRALQACLELAPAGAIVRLRRGAVYRVNTNFQPTWDTFGGLKLKSGQTLELNGAELKALPTRHHRSAVVQAFGVDRWEIRGPGRITGERDIHLGSGGEWGMGIAVLSAKNWKIVSVEVNNCWGDGIYVDGRAPIRAFSEDFVIDRVHVWNCRRNGISVVAGRNGEITGANIHHISGTNPQGAIDLEPDDPRKPNRNIRIRNGKFRETQVGVYVTVANEDILITGMDIEAVNSGVIVSDYSARVQIIDNPRIANTGGGAEGAAIRTVTANPGGVRNLHIRRNGLHGGGFFVLELFGQGYPDLVVSNNKIHASSPGVVGIARMGSGQFTDNVAVIERNAGKEGEFYVQFDAVTHARNSYRNLSRHKMKKLVGRGGRDLGGETYSGPQ